MKTGVARAELGSWRSAAGPPVPRETSRAPRKTHVFVGRAKARDLHPRMSPKVRQEEVMRMRRKSAVLAGVLFGLTSCLGTSACSSAEEANDPGVRWKANAQTAGALGITHWVVSGNEQRAELSGVRTTDGVDALVVHGVLGRDAEHLYIDVDLPKAWHLDSRSGEVPVVSGQIPAKVGIALAGSALELLDQVRTSGRSTQTHALAMGGGSVRLQDLLSGGGDPSAGSLIGSSSCLSSGSTQLLEYGPRYTGINAPYQGFELLDGLPAGCTPWRSVYTSGPQPSADGCKQAAQTYYRNSCPGGAVNVVDSSVAGTIGQVLSMVLQHSLEQDRLDAEKEKDTKDAEADDCSEKTTYYRDADGDGIGGTEAKSACKSPGDGWVTKNGDCNDGDKNVFPGQTSYFGQPYQKDGATSYDYDCNGNEEQASPERTAAATCTLLEDKSSCTGSGYVVTPGNALCGAVRLQTCTFNGKSCEPVLSDVEPTRCR